MSKRTKKHFEKAADKGFMPRIVFGGGAIGLAVMTAWRNIEGRLAGASNDADVIKEIMTGASMEAVGVGAAALAIFGWKHNKARALALAGVAAFAYTANTRAAHENIAAQVQRAENVIESEGASAAVLSAQIADLETGREAIVSRYDGHVPRDADTLDAWVNNLPGGPEENPINVARAESEKADRAEYDRLSEDIAAKIVARAHAEVLANDELHGTGQNGWGELEIYGMQAIQALGWWLADTSSRHRSPAPSPKDKNSRPMSDAQRASRRKWAIIRGKQRAAAQGPEPGA